jgi:hypothetical protein
MPDQNILFHATQESGIKQLSPDYGHLGEDAYLYRSPEGAMESGAIEGDGDVTAVRIYETKLSADAKLYKSERRTFTDEEIEAIKKEVYDGIETRAEVVIFDPQKHTQIIKERWPTGDEIRSFYPKYKS